MEVQQSYRQILCPSGWCGRVCPQETQCEENVSEALRESRFPLENWRRFVADWSRENGFVPRVPTEKTNGRKVAENWFRPCRTDLRRRPG